MAQNPSILPGRARANRASRNCAFCAGSPLTGEHIWPAWASDFFPKTPHDTRIEFNQTAYPKTGVVTSAEKQERHGHTTTKKLRVVCFRCNSTWMSRIENLAKPTLVELLQGHSFSMTPEQISHLQHWITLKFLVLDLSIPTETVFIQENRTAFWRNREIPKNLKVWLFPYDGINWRSSMRQGAHLIGTSPLAPPHGSWAKNTKTLTLGFGALLVQAFFTHLNDFDQYATIDYAGSVVHLIPSNRSIVQWPPGLPIHEDGADYVALTMDRLAQSPKVLQVR